MKLFQYQLNRGVDDLQDQPDPSPSESTNYLPPINVGKRSNNPVIAISVIALLGIPILLWPYPDPIELPGVVDTRDDDTVSSSYAGKIEKIYSYKGGRIRRGDPIVEIDSERFREDAISAKTKLAALRRDVSCVLNGVEKLGYTPAGNHIAVVRNLLKDIEDGLPLGFHIGCTDYSTFSLDALEAKIKEKQDTVLRLKGLAKDFKAELAVQAKQVKHYEDAAEKGLISKVQIEQAERLYLQSKKEFNDTIASIPVAQQQLRQAEIDLKREKAELMLRFQDMLNNSMTNYAAELEKAKSYPSFSSLVLSEGADNYVVKANRDGVISGEGNHRVGDYVSVGGLIANIMSENSGMFIVAQAAADDRRMIAIGDRAVVTFKSQRSGGYIKLNGSVIRLASVSNSLFESQKTVQTSKVRVGLYPVEIGLSSLTTDSSSDLKAQLIAGEPVSVIVEGPTTNLLFTFIQSLRLSWALSAFKS
jgi:multidrug resistance efflux pump